VTSSTRTALDQLIAKVQRYDLMTNYRCGSTIEEMERADDGEWVRVADLESLLSSIPVPRAEEGDTDK